MSKITVTIEELRAALSCDSASDHSDLIKCLCEIFDTIYRPVEGREVKQSITIAFTEETISITRYASKEVYRNDGTFYWYQRTEINGINWTTSYHLTPIGTWSRGYNYPIAEIYKQAINDIPNLENIAKELSDTKIEITA